MEIRMRLGGMRNAPWDVKELLGLGRLMEARPEVLRDVAAGWLRVRDREGVERRPRSNAVQRAYERERCPQTTTPTGRQRGMSTWDARRSSRWRVAFRRVMQGALWPSTRGAE